jgi:hypothetical protein
VVTIRLSGEGHSFTRPGADIVRSTAALTGPAIAGSPAMLHQADIEQLDVEHEFDAFAGRTPPGRKSGPVRE